MVVKTTMGKTQRLSLFGEVEIWNLIRGKLHILDYWVMIEDFHMEHV